MLCAGKKRACTIERRDLHGTALVHLIEPMHDGLNQHRDEQCTSYTHQNPALKVQYFHSIIISYTNVQNLAMRGLFNGLLFPIPYIPNL